jgi:hypothetical protein
MDPAALDATLASQELRAADWVDADTYIDDAVFGDLSPTLDGDAVLAHYRSKAPDAIVDEPRARWQCMRREMRFPAFDPGSPIADTGICSGTGP